MKDDKEFYLEKLREADSKVEGNLSYEKFKALGLVEKPHKHKTVFNGWNDAKEKAGLETVRSNRGRYEDGSIIVKELQEYAEENGDTVKLQDFLEGRDISRITVQRYFGSYTNLCDEAGVRPFNRYKSNGKDVDEKIGELREEYEYLCKYIVAKELDTKKIYRGYKNTAELCKEKGIRLDLDDVIAEKMSEKLEHGFYSSKDLREFIESEIGYCPYKNCMKMDGVFEEAEKIGFNISKPKNATNNAFYVDQGKYDSEDKFTRKMREKWDGFCEESGYNPSDEFFSIFIDYIGKGYTPKGVFSGIVYLTTGEEETQRKIGDKVGVTEVTCRNNKKKLVEDDALPEESLNEEKLQ